MYTARGRGGVSKVAVPVAIIAVIVLAGAYSFLMRGPAAPPSSSASSQSTVSVSTAVNQFLQDINNRSVDGLANFYTSSSIVHWSGNLGGLQGLYAGADNIRLLYAATVGKTTTMNANATKYAQDVFTPTRANATYNLVMLANSTVAGKLNATISVSQEWDWGKAGWQISRENWAYTHFDASLLDAKYGSVTTFPQWGYLLKGGNPNLVPEKSFEWHAGPYVAAAVYAFLFGVVAMTALRLRSTGGSPRPEERRVQRERARENKSRRSGLLAGMMAACLPGSTRLGHRDCASWLFGAGD